MYRVLLVDDEKIIREGVYELLSMADLDLDLIMAASAVEALSILEERKIDIVLMDICMPQMSGMELYDVIREKWPHSKMIFLTGYLEFDYVYKVHKHARYVLKAEEDYKIVDAVKESIEEIENDLLLERVTEDRSRHQQRNKYYERMLLLKELVDGSGGLGFITQDMLEQMDMDIDLEADVYVVMIRCASMRQLDYKTQYQVGESMGLLIEKYFLELFRGTYVHYNKNLTYLLLQPNKSLSRAEKTLEGFSETFQKAVSKNLGVDVSIFIGETPFTFQQAMFITNLRNGAVVGFKYFDLSATNAIRVEVRGSAGTVRVWNRIGGTLLSETRFEESTQYGIYDGQLNGGTLHSGLFFEVETEGAVDFRAFELL